jgi:hypothetical protein
MSFSPLLGQFWGVSLSEKMPILEALSQPLSENLKHPPHNQLISFD